jgi:hypothetical protein
MNVFISWAGTTSKAMALLLRKYLPAMLQGLKVFMSKGDIASGDRWPVRLGEELAQSNFGILCLTPLSAQSHWLIFEAGALTKLPEGRACGLLHGMKPGDVTWPLAQFQHKSFEPEQFKELIHDLNHLMATPLPAETVDLIFEQWWPKIEKEVAELPADPPPADHSQGRSTGEMLEEVLSLVRGLARVVSQDTSRRQQRLKVMATPREPASKSEYAWFNHALGRLPSQSLRVIESCVLAGSGGENAVLAAIDDDLLKNLLANSIVVGGPDGLGLHPTLREILAARANPEG